MIVADKASTQILAAINVPGGVQPPGTQGANDVISYAVWAFSLACFLGLLAVGANWLKNHRGHGGGGEKMEHLGWVFGALIVGSAAGPIVNHFIA